MLRVLHSVSNMDRAGIETMLMNYYRRIDRDVLQFDFLANKPKPGDYDEEIRSMGGHIYVSPGLNPIRYPDYIKYMRKILAADRDIAIVHAHNEAMGYYALRGAERAGIKTRIAHAHNTRIIRDYKWPLKMMCKLLLPHAASNLWACGRDAGIYFFGRQRWNAGGMVMRNAIDTARFRFDPEVRAAVRAENGLGDRTVIGHVGRFNMQKNHTRLLDIYAAYMRRDPNSILVLIGEGELEGRMREKARALGIADNVLFAGLQSRVDRWYQAMDVFLLPSLFEGLRASFRMPLPMRSCSRRARFACRLPRQTTVGRRRCSPLRTAIFPARRAPRSSVMPATTSCTRHSEYSSSILK